MPANYDQPDYVEKRLRYFDGQFLKDQDFIDEQKYHIDRHRRHNRSLHVSGIVDGFEVTPGSVSTSNLATVTPGTAIDSKGRQLVMATPRSLALSNFQGKTVDVFLAYNEEASDPAQPLDSTQQSQEILSNPRWFETPQIITLEKGQPSPSDALWLARLAVSQEGVVNLDTSINLRQYAGVNLPLGGTGNTPLTLRSNGDTANPLAVLSGNLSVSNDLSVNGSLNVVGILKARDNLNVSGKLSVTRQLAIDCANPTDRKLEISSDISGLSFEAGTGTPNAGAIRFGDNSGWKLHFGRSRESTNAAPNAKTTGVLMTIQDNGNVGIGTTTPATRLEVSGTTGVLMSVGAATGSTAAVDLCGDFRVRSHGADRFAYIQARDDSSDSQIGLRFKTQKGRSNLTDAMTIDPQGRVGIGTVTPNARLEIFGTDSETLLSVGATSKSKANIDLCGHVQLKAYDQSAWAYLQARDDNSKGSIGLRIRTQKGQNVLTEAISIDPNGNVGVSGNIQSNSELTVAGNITTQSGSILIKGRETLMLSEGRNIQDDPGALTGIKSPNGQYLFAMMNNGEARVWSFITGTARIVWTSNTAGR